MRTSWAGWSIDAAARRLYAPRSVILGRVEAEVIGALILAEGGVLSRRTLGEAIATASSSKDPANLVGMTVFNINKRVDVRPARIANVRRFGYRLLPATTMLEPEDDATAIRRVRVEAILVDQFEATGPHARAVARLIEEAWS